MPFFALLFGFTFYIQSANQQRKGKDFGYRFLWRLLLLVAFATLNAAFFSGRRCAVAVLGSGNRIVCGAQVE